MSGAPFVLNFAIQTMSPLRLPSPQSPLAAGGPVLSGSTLKGAARRSAEVVASLLGLPVCRQDADPQCSLCRLFGAPDTAGTVHWSVAALTDNAQPTSRPDALEARRRQPVDRALGKSAGTVLPTRVAIPAGLRFGGSLHGWLAGDGRADAALLAASLLRLDYLAGGNAAGYGRVSVSIGELRLAGVPQDSDELVDSLLAQEVV